MEVGIMDRQPFEIIIEAFRDYLDAHSFEGRPYFDILYSKRFDAYFRLCDVTPNGNMSAMEATAITSPDKLFEAFLDEISSDFVYSRPKKRPEQLRDTCIRRTTAILENMSAQDRAVWMPVMQEYYNAMDFTIDPYGN